MPDTVSTQQINVSYNQQMVIFFITVHEHLLVRDKIISTKYSR